MAKDQIQSFKELAILEYLSRIDFKRDKWSVQGIQADLRRILKEEPAVDIDWQRVARVNEILQTEEIIEQPRTLTVWYTTDALRAGDETAAGQVTIVI